MSERDFLRRWDLILPSALAPAAEAGLILALGPKGSAALAPQVTAPPPFDLFHDLRWISVYHRSWWLLALELATVVLLRSLWVSWIVHRAWSGPRAPAMGPATGRVATYQAIASVLLAPWVLLLFGLAATHISFLFFAAIPPLLAIAAAIHGGAVSRAAGHGWRWGPTGPGLTWILGAFVWLSAVGALIDALPAPAAVAVAGSTGLANARAWYGIARSLTGNRRRAPRKLLAPALVAATFVAAVGGSALGFAVAVPQRSSPARSSDLPTILPGQHPVLVARGLYSRFVPAPLAALPDGYVAWPFSYRGLDPRGWPLPYEPADTLQPVTASARLMVRQVEALWRASGRPVTIVAESEGALVARAYLVRFYRSRWDGPVDRLVVLGMNAGPASVYFPPKGEEGWGVGTGWALRGLARVIGAIAPLELSMDAPLVRELTDRRPMLARVVRSPLPPGIEEVYIQALADWVDRPRYSSSGARTYVVPAAHGGLMSRADVQGMIVAVLENEDPSAVRPGLAEELLSGAAAAWHVPALPPSLLPARPYST